MSKIALSGNPSGTGTFTIASPNSNTDRTLTLPDEAGTVLTSASSLAAANLTGDVAAARITGALNAGGSAPIYACRAWVNFNGTTTPPTIRASGNVSSITDNGTGDYTVNFTTAMLDANYVPLVTGCSFSTVDTTRIANIYGAQGTGAALKTTTQVRFLYGSTSAVALADCAEMNVVIFR